MWHINRCTSEWNLQLQLGSRAGPWVSILCLLQDNIHIYWLHPPKKSTTKEQEILQKIKLPANGIVLPSPTYTETIERTGQKTSCIVQPGHTSENPALRGVDLKPSPERWTNRSQGLLNLYWLSWSLPLKEYINRISYKSTLVDPIKSSCTWKETNQILKRHALQHIKTSSPKTSNSINSHDWD